ncbi:uncharacterized protein (DUF1800 family) [Aliiruegeria haliotis]|uniref:Uncharacterized protein (DUF1800 family) n=1 Tax=Aliiruegeria haliotis TaxID=1280846 RepID=A0A2T0RWR5_9RHOB|nr:DUF1800 domain-containing protein [Aliiruegeria haliotis]PRY25590.1 uncharacterized protein (DUF1800 family) [Aliiruegeria haliotis]
MAFDPTLAEFRFGTGRSPRLEAPASVDAMLSALTRADSMVRVFPVPPFSSIAEDARRHQSLQRAIRRNEGDVESQKEEFKKLRSRFSARKWRYAARQLARGLETEDGFRERLVAFWADHFTVVSKSFVTRPAVSMFIDEAIRPHVAGRFADLLRAATLHPMMLFYLDQTRSVGPNSPFAKGKPNRGLNENLAREVLELHSLGVDGAYGQDDVRQLAELFAGLGGNVPDGFKYFERRGEPGPEYVLGRAFGRRKPKIEDVHEVLDTLATHPDTAAHVARKLAVHFFSDTPDPDLVAALETRFLETGGDLTSVYAALLEHPTAFSRPMRKVRRPVEFIVAGLRALGMRGKTLTNLTPKRFRQLVTTPAQLMGQTWQTPTGPDGWPEDTGHWITPQGLAARIDWAMGVQGASELELSDPRDFVDVALGSLASERTLFAAGAAETRGDGIGLVLSSPEFQRR